MLLSPCLLGPQWQNGLKPAHADQRVTYQLNWNTTACLLDNFPKVRVIISLLRFPPPFQDWPTHYKWRYLNQCVNTITPPPPLFVYFHLERFYHLERFHCIACLLSNHITLAVVVFCKIVCNKLLRPKKKINVSQTT